MNDEAPLAAGTLSGIRALVTGSSRGIGADTARYLADAGARVAINFRNKEARALKVVAGIEEAGERPSPSAPTSPLPTRSPRCSP
ncbi:hypothetical protein GCM10025881_40000 [Pseudolysinimonas kribbensis]|uniref:SDR family NAD(P)-dependent oxidoreductase n=1 Tax=Pseudolysinimonas kribbensis TaxID=433641 RepID=A0ABQ6KGH7_9MICO|nr:hypothetical protein GCM10025881_40000 [Pseudolysinimonas kribbensis]